MSEPQRSVSSLSLPPPRLLPHQKSGPGSEAGGANASDAEARVTRRESGITEATVREGTRDFLLRRLRPVHRAQNTCGS